VRAIAARAAIVHQKYITFATMNANVKAPNAVRNHPAITLTTPFTLYTALSLHHDLSAKAAPIATIKVT
jgi:hypothetical protein